MNGPKTKLGTPRPRGRRRNASRRWCIPPAILREPEETLEGSLILEEFEGDAGLLLWTAHRDVTLWASTPPERRDGLFNPEAAQKRIELLQGAGVHPAVEVSLTTLAVVVGSPGTANAEIVTLVCLDLARWAREGGAWGTAVAFAQAGALSSPEEPGAAYTVGSFAMEWGRYPRAETWLRRAIGLARRGKSWEIYSRGYVELGDLYARRGNGSGARRYYTQAMRAARRHGLLPIRGTALHGLLRLALSRGELDEGERLAKAAMRAYGRSHPRLPALLRDVAYLWVSRESYGRAIPLLQRLLAGPAEAADRARTLALLARAAAGVGDRRMYEEAWTGAWALIERMSEGGAPDPLPLLELARAAVKSRDWGRMEQATRLHTTRGVGSGGGRAAEELAALAADAPGR